LSETLSRARFIILVTSKCMNVNVDCCLGLDGGDLGTAACDQDAARCNQGDGLG